MVFLPGPGWPSVTRVMSRPSTVLPRCDSRASGERWQLASSDRWRSSGYGSKYANQMLSCSGVNSTVITWPSKRVGTRNQLARSYEATAR
ncbi:hypothetical protein D3C80_1792050 [compost metagenome]